MSTAVAIPHQPIEEWKLPSRGIVGMACLIIAESAIFIIFGPVDWAAVVPLGIGMFAGSMIGPRLARHIPARVLRWLVALLGMGLAVKLWIAPA